MGTSLFPCERSQRFHHLQLTLLRRKQPRVRQSLVAAFRLAPNEANALTTSQ
jgi:hypothetical protein